MSLSMADADPRRSSDAGSVDDITERIVVEIELRLLQACVSKLNDIVIVTDASSVDAPGPAIVFVNEAFERVTGYSRAQVLGRSPRFLQCPATDRAELDRLRNAIQRQQPVRVEVVNRSRDGVEYWTDLDVTPIRNSAGTVTHFISVQRLTGERRQAETSLRALAIAEQATRAKSQFMARMSHELRIPLNAVLGFAEVLRLDTRSPLTPGQQSQIRHILGAGHHLLLLINDLLDIARIEAGTLQLRLEPVDARLALQTQVEDLRLMALAAGVGLRLEPAAQPLWVRADKLRLHQVLLNLMSNAIKYNRRGGSVVVGLTADGDRVRPSVGDDGLGMSAVQLQALFEPFNRLGRETSHVEGTGIGLAITRDLVRLMGGSLTVRSEQGSGSEFVVDLPGEAGPAEPLPAAPQDLPAQLDASVSGQVLYVDDDPVNRILMEAFFGLRPAVHLRLAEGARRGLLLAREIRPDILLIDLMMPLMDGVQMLHEVRSDPQLASTHCVAVSANAMPEEVAAALAAGFDAYLTKPLSAAVLFAEVDSVLRTARQAQV